MRVHHCNHVRGVLADQVKQLFPLYQLHADAMNQKMLIDGVEVEEKYEAHQAAHGLRHHVLRVEILVKVSAG